LAYSCLRVFFRPTILSTNLGGLGRPAACGKPPLVRGPVSREDPQSGAAQPLADRRGCRRDSVFVASKQAHKITGQTINVDGGFVMHW
jgi:hypothetical protein